MALGAILGLAGAAVSAGASSRASRAQERSADAQIELARENRDLQQGLYDDQLRRLGGIRSGNIQSAQLLQRQNAERERALRDQNIRTSEGAAGQNRDLINQGFNREVGVFQQARDQNLAGFQPYAATGRNALGSLSYEMGLSDSLPQGVSAMSLSPAARFAMEQGRDTVEAGAMRGGSARSGATMAALEKLRMGLSAQDRETQLDRMSGLANMGFGAEGAMAGVRDTYAQRYGTASGNRTMGLTGVNSGLANSIMGIRSNATNNLNSLNSAVRSQIMNERSNYGAGVGNAMNMFSNNATQGVQMQANALADMGNAQSAGAVGFGNAINSGINNFLQYQQMQQLTGQPQRSGNLFSGNSWG
jgi:hypothetical protein